MNACTIVARNYLAQARVLAQSFLEHHPHGTFTTVLLDDPERAVEESAEPFAILHVDEIGIERAELHRMALIYDVLELSTAVKPWVLRALLDGGRDHVAYFDPDIQVFAPLDDVAEFARDRSIVLTPHTTKPLPHDGLEPSEATILLSGVFNLGFIAVGDGARPFLGWWEQRLRRDCIRDPDAGLFVDQRWVDLVPVFFDHHVLRDVGCNVAAWNLPTRTVEQRDSTYLVNGEPLRFFHFSGFDPRTPYVLSRYQGREPRILLAAEPALSRLCRDYAAALDAKGYGEMSSLPYRFDRLPDGARIDRSFRRAAREAIIAAERRGQPMPDPFDRVDPGAFRAWFDHAARLGASRRLARYARALYDVDPDAWPARFARRSAMSLRAARIRRRERAVRKPRDPSSGAPGVNLAGYFRAELGVAEAARGIRAGLVHAGIPHATVTLEDTISRQQHAFTEAEPDARYAVNVVCVNADRLPAFWRDVGAGIADRYTVGVWFWEVSTLPRSFLGAFDGVDEVWVGSEFASRAIGAHTSKPVLTVPVPVEVPIPPRPAIRLADGFSFLFMFDFLSVLERKNPAGVVEAFARAFAPGEGPVLILKSINGDRRPQERDQLERLVSARPDISLVDGYVTTDERYALLAGCDCYVSLHRGEGFGLTMAEAMAYAKPVIATAYSGNLDFMSERNSYLVQHGSATIPRGCDPYPAGATWADPDLDAAAAAMRRVVADREEAQALGLQAQRDIRERHSVENTAAFLTARLGELGCFPSTALGETRQQGAGDVLDVIGG